MKNRYILLWIVFAFIASYVFLRPVHAQSAAYIFTVNATTCGTPPAVTVPASASFCFMTTGAYQSINGGAWTQFGGTGVAGVTSWNGLTGAVAYTAPVTSVNGKTGVVTIAATTTLQ